MTTITMRKSRPSEAPPTVLTRKIRSFDGAISVSVNVTVVTLGSASVGSIIGAAYIDFRTEIQYFGKSRMN